MKLFFRRPLSLGRGPVFKFEFFRYVFPQDEFAFREGLVLRRYPFMGLGVGKWEALCLFQGH